MTLMGTGAALGTATGVAGRQGSDGDAVAGLSAGPDGIVKEAGSASAAEEAFILSLASCTVHEERQDPTALTATPEQQRQGPPHPISLKALCVCWLRVFPLGFHRRLGRSGQAAPQLHTCRAQQAFLGWCCFYMAFLSPLTC